MISPVRPRLDPFDEGNDIPGFKIQRARIPTTLFKFLVEDLNIIMKQYGGNYYHKNEEAKSRFFAAVSASASFQVFSDF